MIEKDLIRHYLATIHYRGMKYLRNYEKGFSDYSINEEIRKPNQILNHINSLFLYIESFFGYVPDTYPAQFDFPDEIKRFEAFVKRLDSIIETEKLQKYTYEKILQGPLADIMLHIGEISMLRKISGNPADDLENYIEAEITAGQFDLSHSCMEDI